MYLTSPSSPGAPKEQASPTRPGVNIPWSYLEGGNDKDRPLLSDDGEAATLQDPSASVPGPARGRGPPRHICKLPPIVGARAWAGQEVVLNQTRDVLHRERGEGQSKVDTAGGDGVSENAAWRSPGGGEGEIDDGVARPHVFMLASPLYVKGRRGEQHFLTGDGGGDSDGRGVGGQRGAGSRGKLKSAGGTNKVSSVDR